MPTRNELQDSPEGELAAVAMDVLWRLAHPAPPARPHGPDLADFRDAFRIYVAKIQVDAQVQQMEFLTNSAAAKAARELFLLQHSINLRQRQKELADEIKALKAADGR